MSDLRELIARAIEAESRRVGDSICSWLEGMRDAADIARQTSPWIAADAHPPEPDQEVLTCSSLTGYHFIATWDATNGIFRSDGGDIIPGLYWMALPEPPPRGGDPS